MNIKRVMANLVVHIKQFTREKSTMFFVLLFPILLMLLFGFIFSGVDDTTYNLSIQDNDGGYWATKLVDGLNITDDENSTGVFNVIKVDISEEPYEYMNSSGENVLVVIPAGFSARINSTDTVYDYLGRALEANSAAMNHTLLALGNSGDAMNNTLISLNYSMDALVNLELATDPSSPNSMPTALQALDSTANALNYTTAALGNASVSLNYTGLALLELGNAMNFTIEAMTYEIAPDPALNLTIYFDETDTIAQTKVQILNSVIGGFNKGLSGARDIIGLGEPQSVNPEKFEFIDFFAPGIIAMSVMTTSLFGTVGMNTELKQKGILKKLATTPLTRTEWLLSNIFYQLFMSLLSTVCILGVGMGIFGLKPYINIYMFIFILLNVFAFSGIGMLITRYVKEAESAQAAANAVMFPMMFLSGTFFQLEMMPDFLQTIAKFLPLYYVNEGLRAAMISLDTSVILECAVVIGIFGLAVFILGVFLTSWKED